MPLIYDSFQFITLPGNILIKFKFIKPVFQKEQDFLYGKINVITF